MLIALPYDGKKQILQIGKENTIINNYAFFIMSQLVTTT